MTPLQREALQMCLEYIETDAHERRHVRWKINEALAEPQQEPVAWRVKWPAIGGGHKWLMVDLPLMEKEGFVNEALYTSSPAQEFVCSTGLCHYKPAAPVQEPVALAKFDGTLHWIEPYGIGLNRIDGPLYTAPPAAQRPWIGLSPVDRGECLSAGDAHGWIGVMEATEAKLKEKNT